MWGDWPTPNGLPHTLRPITLLNHTCIWYIPTIWEGVLRVCVLHVCGWVLINPPDDTITGVWDPGRACLHWETVEMWTSSHSGYWWDHRIRRKPPD